jgi:hypothetical protein
LISRAWLLNRLISIRQAINSEIILARPPRGLRASIKLLHSDGREIFPDASTVTKEESEDLELLEDNYYSPQKLDFLLNDLG